jgi:type IV secretory pathway VirB4 component
VLEALAKSKSERVKSAAELLLEQIKNTTLSLCFSDGQNETIDMTKRITIIEITGLELPTSLKADLSVNQRQSLVVLYALGQFCVKFGEENKRVETLTFIDEAWFFEKTAVGRDIIMKIKRTGRSGNNFLIYITQSLKDSETEDDDTGFGTTFAFNSSTEVDEILTLSKLEVTSETRKWVSNMGIGQCIFMDTFGRSERITIDGIIPEVNELCKTIKTDLVAV